MLERRLACVCFPNKGDASANQRRVRQYARMVLDGELEPFVPHQFYATFLDDTLANERNDAVKMRVEPFDEVQIPDCLQQTTDLYHAGRD